MSRIPEYPVDELVYASSLEKAYGMSPNAYEYYCRMQYALNRFLVFPEMPPGLGGRLESAASRRDALYDAGYRPLTGDFDFDDFVVDFVHSTASIEGSQLSVYEVARLLAGDDVVRERVDMRQVSEIEDIQDAFLSAIGRLSSGDQIDVGFLLDVHLRAAARLEDSSPGSFRKDQRYLTSGSAVLPPPPDMVPDLVDGAVTWYNEKPSVARALGFHLLFEDIHPFQDGNGRTGRILLNCMLMKLGYPAISLKPDAVSRRAYYDSIRAFCEDIEHRDCSSFAFLALERLESRLSGICDSFRSGTRRPGIHGRRGGLQGPDHGHRPRKSR